MKRFKNFPRLTDSQIAVIAEIVRNAGLVVFGATVVPPLFDNVDRPDWMLVLLSLADTLTLWMLSVILVRNIKSI